MAITDIFKKQTKMTSKTSAGGDKKAAPDVDVKKDKVDAKMPKKSAVLAGRILIGAHITEKAADLADKNQYIFKVAKNRGKKEISRAVEDYFGVNAVSVNVVNVPGRRRRNRHGVFFESGFRKAIVRIKKGQTIGTISK